MADEPVVSAPGGGASDAGGGGAAPVASSSPAPATTPVTSTPAAAPVTTEPAVVPATITRNPGESEDAFMSRYREQQKAAEPLTGDEKPGEVKPPVKTEEPAKPAAEVKPEIKPEVKEDPKPEVKAEEPAPVESKLAQTLFGNEKVKAVLEEAGVTDELAEELRTASEGRQFKELFVDLQTATFAKSQAAAFTAADLSASNLKLGDMGSTREFVQNVLMPMGYILKEDGTPEMVETTVNGQTVSVPRTDGTVDVLLSNLGDMYLDHAVFRGSEMLKFAETHPDDPKSEGLRERGERLLGWADGIREEMSGKEPEPEGMTPEMKAERAKIDADKKAFVETKQRDATERFERFRTDLVDQSNKALDGVITDWLDQTSLAPAPADSQQTKDSKAFLRSSISREIRDGLFEKLNSDQLFVGEQEQKGRRGAGALKDLVSTYVRYANKYVFGVASPILTKAGHERVQQSKARSSKIAAQQDATRTDARAGTKPATPTAPKVDERQVMREVTTELQAKLGRYPNDDEKVAAWREAMAKAKVAV